MHKDDYLRSGALLKLSELEDMKKYAIRDLNTKFVNKIYHSFYTLKQTKLALAI